MTRDEICEDTATIQAQMGLNHWEISVSFSCSKDAYAECIPEPQYWRANISFNLDKCKGDKDIIRKAIIHEMVHCVISPYTLAASVFAGSASEVLTDLEEAVVTHIENWPLWDIE